MGPEKAKAFRGPPDLCGGVSWASLKKTQTSSYGVLASGREQESRGVFGHGLSSIAAKMLEMA